MIEYEKDYFETKLDNGNTLAIEDFLDGAIDTVSYTHLTLPTKSKV